MGALSVNNSSAQQSLTTCSPGAVLCTGSMYGATQCNTASISAIRNLQPGLAVLRQRETLCVRRKRLYCKGSLHAHRAVARHLRYVRQVPARNCQHRKRLKLKLSNTDDEMGASTAYNRVLLSLTAFVLPAPRGHCSTINFTGSSTWNTSTSTAICPNVISANMTT